MNQHDISKINISIVGIGLMGGSLALGLHGRCRSLIGVDVSERILNQAKQLNVFDTLTTNLQKALDQSEMIILAAPVRTILDLLELLNQFPSNNQIVLDVGSTKVEIVSKMGQLANGYDPIGGHPMCGKEKSSLTYAEREMFIDAPFVLSPLERTSENARQLAEQLVLTVGAKPLWLDPSTHDRWVAMTSHLPFILSNALSYIAPLEVAPLVGSGFRSTTRLASSSSIVMRDILETNRNEVLKSIREYQSHLTKIEALLSEEEFDSLQTLLEASANKNQLLID